MGSCASRQSSIVHATITVQPYTDNIAVPSSINSNFSPNRPAQAQAAAKYSGPSQSEHYYELRRTMINPHNKSFKRALTVSKLADEHNITEAEVSLKRYLTERKRVKGAEFYSPGRVKESQLYKKSSDSSQSTCVTVLSDDDESYLFEDEFGLSQEEFSAAEQTCQSVISELVPTEKEARDEVRTLLTLWEESDQLSTIKNHARSASAELTADLVSLAEYLTMSDAKYVKNLCHNASYHVELAKAFSIYFWISTNISYDSSLWQKCLNEGFSAVESSPEVEAEEVLKERSSICIGFSNLFAAMAKAAGIDVVVIKGEVSNVPIPATSGDEDRASSIVPHTWNAIQLHGTWLPLDCTFGSSFRDKSMDFKSLFTRHFFAICPSQLILTHWPYDEKWQLLKSPVARHKLEPIVVFPACAFGKGVRPSNWSRTISLRNREHSTTVKLAAKTTLKIGAKLVYLEDNVQKCQDIQTSDNLIYIEWEGDQVQIQAALPFKGSYSLMITVCQEVKRSTQPPQVCLSYHLTSKTDSEEEIGYPKVYELAASAFDFKPVCWNQSASDCVCESSTGKLSLAFKAKKGMTSSHFLISGKTRITRPTDTDTVYNYNSMIIANKAINTDEEQTQTLHMLKVVFPEKGWWTICLSGMKANPNKQIQGGYTTLMSYQVFARKGIPNLTYPNILSQQVSVYRFDPISTVSESLEIPFISTKPMEFQAFLTEKKETATELDSFVQVQEAELVSPLPNQYQLKAIFPKPGSWFVHVFGKEMDSSHEASFNALFRLLVDVDRPMTDAITAVVNTKFAESISLSVADKGYISFADEGLPLAIGFICGEPGVSFQHQVRPEGASITDTPDNMSLLEHCSFLVSLGDCDGDGDEQQARRCSVSVLSEIKEQKKRRASLSVPNEARAVDVRRNSTPVSLKQPFCSAYRLYASFPWAGRWIVELFAKDAGHSSYTLAFHVSLDISKPSKGVCFPKIHPGFHKLGISVSEQFASYNPTCSTSEFELPFNAPDNLQFAWNLEVAGSDKKFPQQGFVHQFGNRNPSHHFQLSFNTPGVWNVQLFAAPNHPDDNETSPQPDFLPILEVSLSVETIDREVAFPNLYPAFHTFGLSIAKTHLPFISHVTFAPAEVVIPFYSPPGVKFWHRVDEVSRYGEEIDMLTKMLSNSNSGLHELMLEITQAGVYQISLWAQLKDSVDKKWTSVLQHKIKCTIR